MQGGNLHWKIVECNFSNGNLQISIGNRTKRDGELHDTGRLLALQKNVM